MSVPLPAVTCPSCAKKLDRASDLTGHSPKAGDVTICLYCEAILVFTEGLGVRLMIRAEFRKASEDPGFVRAIAQALLVVRAFNTGRQLLQSKN